jgi:uncharacterized protein involved in tolerance to divalent cations
MKVALFYTTCQDNFEADQISMALLKKKLIVCAKKLPIQSSFLWHGKIEQNANEVMLIIESLEENFAIIEKEIKKHHSYQNPLLFMIPTKTTKEVEKWIKEELS